MSLTIDGIEDLKKVLEEFAPKHAVNLSRSVIHSLASKIAKESKTLVPVNTGNLKKAIKAKRRRSKPENPHSDVIIEKGKSKKNDGFYWHFIEYGTGGPVPQPERPFLRPAKDLVVSQMPTILEQEFKKKLVGLINREKKKAAKK